MVRYWIAEQLNISNRNLKYYAARFARELTWGTEDNHDVARIALFRKLGFSVRWIQWLRKGKCEIKEAFDNSPKLEKRIAASDLELLRSRQWESISFEDCAAIIKRNTLSTPNWDVIFWGRFVEEKVLAVVLGVVMAGIVFAFRHQWERGLDGIIYCVALLLVYLSAYAVVDEIVGRKRLRSYCDAL